MAGAGILKRQGRKTPPVSTALSRGLRLLSVFAEAPVWMSNSDIVERTHLPAATVARLTKSLALMGLLHYSASRRRFRLAPGVVRLGYGARSEAQIVELTRPYLQEIADNFRVHTALAVIDGTDALHLEVCHSSATLVTLRLEAGSRIPLAASPIGHALISCLEETQLGHLMAALERHHGGDWSHLAQHVEQGLSEIEEQGFALSLGNWHEDVHGVAVPLRPSGQLSAMSIACGAPRAHTPPSRLRELGQELLHLSAALSTRAQNTQFHQHAV